MRSSKLIPALAAASALLVLAPAGAAARPAGQKHLKNASPNGRCRISLLAEPRAITSGETVQLSGQLLCTGGSTENQPVSVYERTGGSPVFKVIGTPTTVAKGAYALAVPAVATDSWFYVRALSARSGNKAVRVAPVVKIKGPAGTELHTGAKNPATFTGTVTPADVGAEVVLQRELASAKEEWVQVKRGIVGPGGVFTLTKVFSAPGDANLRAVVKPHGTTFTVRGISETLNYLIAQPQNPNLLLESTANPISYGAPTTLKGVLKGGAGKPITLLSHKKGSSTFSLVTTAIANGEGKYEFVQAPLSNTYYRVTGGGETSRQLFEGVKYIVTAAANASTIQSGQSVTVSGTVTPGLIGKKVFLQRENTFGGGFHSIDSGLVGAGGTYSITHAVFGPTKAAVFRIKVPGDLENQGIASSPMSVEVTLAPPLALAKAKKGK